MCRGSVKQWRISGIGGNVESTDVDVHGNHGSNDIWILKLTSAGDTIWTRCYGGSLAEGLIAANSMCTFPNGDFIFCGAANSNDGDVSGNHWTSPSNPSADLWVVKADSLGNILWQRCYGGIGDDYGSTIHLLDSGKIIIGGRVYRDSVNIMGHTESADFFIAELDSLGNFLWYRCYGGSSEDYGESVQPAFNGGFIMAGATTSYDQDVSGNHDTIPGAMHLGDYWIIKLNQYGYLEWKKTLGGTGRDWANSVIQTQDSCYVISGYSGSGDGDVIGNHPHPPGYYDDYWVVKLNPAGHIMWSQCYGGSGSDGNFDLKEAADGGLLAIGLTCSFDGDVSGNTSCDAWLIKLNNGITTSAALPDSYIWDFTAITSNDAGSTMLRYYSGKAERAQIRLMDLTGKELYKKEIETVQGINYYPLHIRELLPGVYLVRYSSNGIQRTVRIFIN